MTPARPGGSRLDARPLITPEGVDLQLSLASTGERFAAFAIDVAILLGCIAGLSLLSLLALMAVGRLRFTWAPGVIGVVWVLALFAFRNGYFMGFEMSGRAATPGKRVLGLRVASRDGVRLTAAAVFARNATREVELFLPLGFVGADLAARAPLLALSGLGWSAGMLALPLLTRDRLRAGDFVGGTWVIRQPKRALRRDMARTSDPTAQFSFTTAQLDAYGEHELQVLEEVLRRGHRDTVAEVAKQIRYKIGWPSHPDESDFAFLDAFYSAQRRTLERNLLFGRRRRDKLDRPHPLS